MSPYRMIVAFVLFSAIPTASWAFDIPLPGGGRICDTCGGGVVGGSRLPQVPPVQTLQSCLTNLASCPQAVIDEHRNDLELANACVRDLPRCPERVLKSLPARALRPLIDTYIADLRTQAKGRWNSLPNWVLWEFSNKYSVNLQQVRYATGINTWHGQGVTVGYEIFFPRGIDLSQRADLEWLLHELQHVDQYERKGGIDAFITEYLLHASGEVIASRKLNVHDDVSSERDAIAKASNLIGGYGRQFRVENNCRYPVQVSVYILNAKNNVWENYLWWNIAANSWSWLFTRDAPIHSKNGIWLIYAEIPGENYQWTGDYKVTTTDGRTLMHRQVNTAADRQRLEYTLQCTNKVSSR
jgi:hypothetical protein